MEIILKAIENAGFCFLIRTDKEKGYFVNVYNREFQDSGYTKGISCIVYDKNILAALTEAFGMAKNGMSNNDVLTCC